MFDYIKMILSVIANVTRNTTVNLQKKKTPNESEFLIFNALCAIVTCLALIVFCKRPSSVRSIRRKAECSC